MALITLGSYGWGWIVVRLTSRLDPADHRPLGPGPTGPRPDLSAAQYVAIGVAAFSVGGGQIIGAIIAIGKWVRSGGVGRLRDFRRPPVIIAGASSILVGLLAFGA